MKLACILILLIMGLFYSVHTEYTVKVVQDPQNTIENPYAPPVRYVDDDYTQLGYLKRQKRVPLFGKPCNLRRDLWYYYTIMDGVKLPITYKRKKSMRFPGCESVSSKDIVHVEEEEWVVELYDM